MQRIIYAEEPSCSINVARASKDARADGLGTRVVCADDHRRALGRGPVSAEAAWVTWPAMSVVLRNIGELVRPADRSAEACVRSPIPVIEGIEARQAEESVDGIASGEHWPLYSSIP